MDEEEKKIVNPPDETPKSLPANMSYCTKCRKTMNVNNFYTHKDGSRDELCKACLTMHVNNWEPDTYLWLLERFDVPYIEEEWNVLRDRAYAKDPYKMTGMSVFGRYLSKMKLKQWMNFNWADTERLKAEAEEKARLFGKTQDKLQEQMDEMKKALDNGEISEAQYKTFAETHAPEPTFSADSDQRPQHQGSSFAYPANSQFEEVELVDVGAELTAEDKIYLAMKWGRLYRADEWVALEQLYNEFMESFDIQGAARIDTLKMICKTSLKMNQAIDCGDIETYQKLSRVYDAMMKSAKFTEAQRDEEKSGNFDSVGQIVYFAEKERGRIPRYKPTEPLDLIDKAIADLKKYNHDLVVNDPALAQMFENFIKRREYAQSHKEDVKAAEEAGLDTVKLTNEDFTEYHDFVKDDRQEKEEGEIL